MGNQTICEHLPAAKYQVFKKYPSMIDPTVELSTVTGIECPICGKLHSVDMSDYERPGKMGNSGDCIKCDCGLEMSQLTRSELYCELKR